MLTGDSHLSTAHGVQCYICVFPTSTSGGCSACPALSPSPLPLWQYPPSTSVAGFHLGRHSLVSSVRCWLCASGVFSLALRNAAVGLDHIDKPANMRQWVEFHNGVAAGLRIAPGISKVSQSEAPICCKCMHKPSLHFPSTLPPFSLPTHHPLFPFLPSHPSPIPLPPHTHVYPHSWTPRGSYSTTPQRRIPPTPMLVSSWHSGSTATWPH